MSEARARAVLYYIMARGLQSSATMRACALDRAVPCSPTTVQGVSGQGGEDVR